MRYKLKKNKMRLRRAIRSVVKGSTDQLVICNQAKENILQKCVDKKIQFDAYYRRLWGICPTTVFNFELDFFKDQKKRDLYLFLAALSDCEIFEDLKSVWKKDQHEELSGQVLHREIFSLQEKGVSI